ncbi:hypothetical protein DPMN_168855, partial [Dreissena polymorpha]
IVKTKANQILIPWMKDIVNHFWFACSKADSYEEFLGISATKEALLHQYHRCYNKKSKHWSVFPEKVAKTYGYIPEMAEMLYKKRIKDKVGMGRKNGLGRR